jgi:hypothetical protein
MAIRQRSRACECRVDGTRQVDSDVLSRKRRRHGSVAASAATHFEAPFAREALTRVEACRQPIRKIISVVVGRPRPLESEGFLRAPLNGHFWIR